MPDRRLALRFTGPEPLRQQGSHFAQGALFVSVPEPPPEPQTNLGILVASPLADDIETEVQVLQVFVGTGMALAVSDPAARDQLTALFARAGEVSESGGELTVSWEEAEVELDAVPWEEDVPKDPEPEPDRATMLERIRAMGTAEKRALALKGSRGERLLLAKDVNKTLHNFLLKNPRITLDEVRAMAGNRQANPEALKLISDNRSWMQSTGVVSALVRNPKTPSSLAVRLLERLPINEIRAIAKANSASMPVLQAAKRKVLGGR